MSPHRLSPAQWARGVLADVAHHDPATIRLACVTLAQHGDAMEQDEARSLLLTLHEHEGRPSMTEPERRLRAALDWLLAQDAPEVQHALAQAEDELEYEAERECLSVATAAGPATSTSRSPRPGFSR